MCQLVFSTVFKPHILLLLRRGNTVEAIQALRKALRAPFGIKKELQVQALNDLAQTVLYMCPPARYPQMAPDAKGEFVPQSQEEEVILALLILEYLLSPPEQVRSLLCVFSPPFRMQNYMTHLWLRIHALCNYPILPLFLYI